MKSNERTRNIAHGAITPAMHDKFPHGPSDAVEVDACRRGEVRTGRNMAGKRGMPGALSAQVTAAARAPCKGGAAGGGFRRIAHFFGAKTSFDRRTRSFAGPKKCRVRRNRSFAGPAAWQVRRTWVTKCPTLRKYAVLEPRNVR